MRHQAEFPRISKIDANEGNVKGKSCSWRVKCIVERISAQRTSAVLDRIYITSFLHYFLNTWAIDLGTRSDQTDN